MKWSVQLTGLNHTQKPRIKKSVWVAIVEAIPEMIRCDGLRA
jgi:hypothetical protein